MNMSLSLGCISEDLKVRSWVPGVLGQLQPEGAMQRTRHNPALPLCYWGGGSQPEMGGPTHWALETLLWVNSQNMVIGLRLNE